MTPPQICDTLVNRLEYSQGKGLTVNKVIGLPSFGFAFDRQLSKEDLTVLSVAKLGVKAPGLARLRAHHHKVAELLAKGLKPGEVSRITGVCLSRISILQSDPTFKELLNYYMDCSTLRAVDDLVRIGTLSRTAMELLQDRMEDQPESMSDKDLLNIAAFGTDRTGLGPTATVNHKHVHLTAEDIAQLKGVGGGAKIISPEDREARARLALPGRADRVEGDQLEIEQSSDQEGTQFREKSTPLAQRVGA